MADLTERWLPVPGWESLYEVSDLGRVRSLPRRGGRGWKGGRVLKHYVGASSRGYPTVSLSRGTGTQKTRQVHQLVLEAFVGPCPPGQEARHGPAGKLDASLLNLCYGTRSENVRDRTRDGQDNRGERSGNAKLTWEKVAEIRECAANGEMQLNLAARFQVSEDCISKVVLGRTWR